MNRIKSQLLACVLFTGLHIVSFVSAQDTELNSGDDSSALIDELLMDYPASFFGRYQPATALDMVRQVPGFQLDNGGSNRGFIAAIGNVLINDVYPSAKQDSTSALLARIPANQVAGIELIRGKIRSIDLQGHSVVVNMILHGDLSGITGT